MSDVARRAGVALGTVSNTLNHPHRVTPELRERVLRAIDELGFVRNRTASNLAAGRSSTVGFVLVDLSNSYFVDMARGAEIVAQRAGQFLVIANSDVDDRKQRSYVEHFIEEQHAGVLLAPVGSNLAGLDRLRAAGRPVVLLDADPDLEGCCAVSTDNVLAGRMAAEHLLALGRTRLAFAGGPIDRSRAIGDRFRGVQEAVEAAGATLEHLPSDEVQLADGRRIGSELARRGDTDLPDGVVAAADLLALGILQSVLIGSQRRFPDDIALIACDDNRSAYDSAIPISTIDLPGHEMGATAMRLLQHEAAGGAHAHHHVMLRPALTARESSVGRRLPGPA